MEPRDVSESPLNVTTDMMLVQLAGRHGGWRAELCVTELNLSEEKLLVCSLCKGILREASVFEVEGRQELRCAVCLPQDSDLSIQILLHIRNVVNEKQVLYAVSFKSVALASSSINSAQTNIQKKSLSFNI